MQFDCYSLCLCMFFTISLLAARHLSQAHYSYTLLASVTHSRYIRPAYFVEDIISRFSHPEHLPTPSKRALNVYL